MKPHTWPSEAIYKIPTVNQALGKYWKIGMKEESQGFPLPGLCKQSIELDQKAVSQPVGEKSLESQTPGQDGYFAAYLFCLFVYHSSYCWKIQGNCILYGRLPIMHRSRCTHLRELLEPSPSC